MGYNWAKIARRLDIPYSTLLFQRDRWDNFVDGARFTDISNNDLDAVISEMKTAQPNAGYRMVQGHLESIGIHVQIIRVQEAMRRVDGEGVQTRKKKAIKRRIYNVPGANWLWHLDGHHKLIRWKFVFHGCIDGFVYFDLNLNVGSAGS